MERLVQMGMLYDFYAPLLTEKQRQIAEAYYFQNLSLAEIAEEDQTSRQAVHDLLHRTEELMLKYEERLELYKGFCRRRQIRDEIGQGLNQLKSLIPDEMNTAIEQIDRLNLLIQDWTRGEEGQEDSE